MMGLYQLKEFLTFDDVADYLRDKGVYDFDLSQNYDCDKLECLLIEWVRLKQLTPVFYNRSTVEVISYQYENGKRLIKHIDGAMLLEGYYSIDITTYEFILKNGEVRTDYQSDYLNNEEELKYHVYKVKSNIGAGGEERKIEYQPYKLIENYTPKILNDCYVNYELFADDVGVITYNEVLYPIAQLDSLFLQHQTTDLQAENARLQARIAELESQLNQANTTPANLKGLDKVNYDKAKARLFAQIVAKSIWDMDTTDQIKSSDMVQYVKSLLLQFDDNSLPETDEVISSWLKDIKPDYAKQSGRPSKDAPNEIPLIFKK